MRISPSGARKGVANTSVTSVLTICRKAPSRSIRPRTNSRYASGSPGSQFPVAQLPERISSLPLPTCFTAISRTPLRMATPRPEILPPSPMSTPKRRKKAYRFRQSVSSVAKKVPPFRMNASSRSPNAEPTSRVTSSISSRAVTFRSSSGKRSTR